MARRLDKHNTTGIFNVELPEQAFAIYGLSSAQPVIVKDLHRNINPREFNRVSRSIWEHMLFDVAAATATVTLEDVGNKCQLTPDINLLSHYLTEDPTQEVCSFSVAMFLSLTPDFFQMFTNFLYDWFDHIDEFFTLFNYAPPKARTDSQAKNVGPQSLPPAFQGSSFQGFLGNASSPFASFPASSSSNLLLDGPQEESPQEVRTGSPEGPHTGQSTLR